MASTRAGDRHSQAMYAASTALELRYVDQIDVNAVTLELRRNAPIACRRDDSPITKRKNIAAQSSRLLVAHRNQFDPFRIEHPQQIVVQHIHTGEREIVVDHAELRVEMQKMRIE